MAKKIVIGVFSYNENQVNDLKQTNVSNQIIWIKRSEDIRGYKFDCIICLKEAYHFSRYEKEAMDCVIIRHPELFNIKKEKP